jgi:hypothetical protein
VRRQLAITVMVMQWLIGVLRLGVPVFISPAVRFHLQPC